MMTKLGIALAGIFIILSCDKEETENKSADLLLTRESWTLYAAGYDDNKNGRIDSHENILTLCQQDNEYRFNKAGTGLISDGVHLCDPAVNTGFTWTLSEDEKEIVISHQSHTILKLDEDHLQLCAKIPWLTTGFITEYSH